MRSLWGGAEKTKEAERMDEIGDEEKSKRMEDLRKMLRSLKIKCESGGEGDGHVTHAPTEADMESDKFQGEAIVEQSGSSVTIMDLSELGPVDEVTQRRFMRAYQYETQLACDRLVKMLRWRASKSYGLDIKVQDIDSESDAVAEQIGSGKCVIFKGRDLIGRPIISVQVRRHIPSKQTPDELTRFGVHILKSAEKLLEEGPELKEEDQQFCIIFDLQGVRLQNIDYDAAKRIIYMLTYFFPERLGICLLVGAPLFFTAAWHIIKPWLHARTQSKILFVQPSQLGSHIAPESLPDWLGGSADDECPSNEYSQP